MVKPEDKGKAGEGKPQPTETKAVIVKVEHKNIFEALSAFLGENPQIKKTKNVKVTSKKGEESSYEFNYSPLDEQLDIVRPLLAKHGLSFVHRDFGEATTAGNYKLVCELYHETYKKEKIGEETLEETFPDGRKVVKTIPVFQETGVLRSAPIVATRSGSNMKNVGIDSTYIRRYTLGELLGLAAEDDLDAQALESRVGQLENFALTRIQKSITEAKTHEDLAKTATALDKDITRIKNGEKAALGLTEGQLTELMTEVTKKKGELTRSGVKPKDVPGENSDNGGKNIVDANS